MHRKQQHKKWGITILLSMQAHFAQLNDRDEAMSRSLNSDYLDQLLIKADTSRLDADLVRLAAEERPVPEEEQALLVFKRGSASQLHPSSVPDVCILADTHKTTNCNRHLKRSAALRSKGASSAAAELTCPVNPCAQVPTAQRFGMHQKVMSSRQVSA